MKDYILHFDGSCGPANPGGTAAYGYILTESGQELASNSRVIDTGPKMSNNYAEFHALACGMTALSQIEAYYETIHPGPAHLQVYGDSKLVINIMNKRWKASPDKLYYPAAEFAFHAMNKLRKLKVKVSFDWVPRTQNQACDTLSKLWKAKTTVTQPIQDEINIDLIVNKALQGLTNE